jgi:hypothetical protein
VLLCKDGLTGWPPFQSFNVITLLSSPTSQRVGNRGTERVKQINVKTQVLEPTKLPKRNLRHTLTLSRALRIARSVGCEYLGPGPECNILCFLSFVELT